MAREGIHCLHFPSDDRKYSLLLTASSGTIHPCHSVFLYSKEEKIVWCIWFQTHLSLIFHCLCEGKKVEKMENKNFNDKIRKKHYLLNRFQGYYRKLHKSHLKKVNGWIFGLEKNRNMGCQKHQYDTMQLVTKMS
jgi:hypothetical protein